MVAMHLADLAKQGLPVFDMTLDRVRRVLDLKVKQNQTERSLSQSLQGLLVAGHRQTVASDRAQHFDKVVRGRLVVFDYQNLVPSRHVGLSVCPNCDTNGRSAPLPALKFNTSAMFEFDDLDGQRQPEPRSIRFARCE